MPCDLLTWWWHPDHIHIPNGNMSLKNHSRNEEHTNRPRLRPCRLREAVVSVDGDLDEGVTDALNWNPGGNRGEYRLT
jgi:hypothetical protein